MASSVETPMQGFSAPQHRPLTVDTPMRTPVKEPGPCATAITSTSDRATAVFFNRSSAIGSSVRLCVSALTCVLCASSFPSRTRATEAGRAEDSKARISMTFFLRS